MKVEMRRLRGHFYKILFWVPAEAEGKVESEK